MPNIKAATRVIHRFYTPDGHNGLPKVSAIHQSLNSIDLDEFRKNAFIPEKPVLISNGTTSKHVLPAGNKWFSSGNGISGHPLRQVEYLLPFADTILPYELYGPPKSQSEHEADNHEKDSNNVLSFLDEIIKSFPDSTFHRFHAPLSLFLSTIALRPSSRPKLYIAQAQLADLPRTLQNDLPIPHLVKQAGKGDIYDANIWIGIPPTYTPLHKDPNPNLFVQLASRKHIRLFPPRVGMEIFRMVQMRVGQNGSSSLRGYEMMEGPEREELEKAVWGKGVLDGVEAKLEPGDALFIPRGWWHSVKSEGEDVNASVNWWFR